ncbi:hypothetical protein [Lentzea sp.]|uniref:hypothetical protein n=1 Tax=Lentzea sp. TaxID=56099 RepID=UPI002ED445C7
MRCWAQDSAAVPGRVTAASPQAHPLLGLQAAVGNRAVQRIVDELPGLPRRPKDVHAAQDRATLLALSGQVAMLNKPIIGRGRTKLINEYQDKIHAELRAPDRTRINHLIREVDARFDDRPRSGQLMPDAPTPEEWARLQREFEKAHAMIAAFDGTGLDVLFGGAEDAPPLNRARAEVDDNLLRIDRYLTELEAHWRTRVKVFQEHGYTQMKGTGAEGQLLVAPSSDDLARTLIHEASHGSDVRTVDYAYSHAPYFLRLPYEVALKNADSYAFACDREAARSLVKPPTEHGFAALAVDRAYFLVSHNWKHVSWLLDVYGTRRDAAPATRADAREHGRRLGFAKGDLPLRIEHLAVLRDFFHLAGTHLGAGRTFGVHRGVLRLDKPGLPTISVPDITTKDSAHAAANAVLAAIAASRGLPDELGVIRESDALFERFYLQDASDVDKKMLEIFG